MVKGLMRFLIGLFVVLFSLNLVSAAVNVVDVVITENIYQEVTYNPLNTGSGVWFDAGEDQTSYNITGQVTITNNHPSDDVSDIVVNLTGISDVYNMVFDSGANGIVSSFNTGSDFAILTIPDLASGATSTFNYTINSTNIEPPLNLTSGYATNVFSGLSFPVTDSLSNSMNSITYPENCIYNITVSQASQGIFDGGSLINFTYDNTTMGGSDANNASFSVDNRTVIWNPWGGNCLYSGNSTDLSYTVNSPAGVSSAASYPSINSTISYRVNTSISTMSVASIAAVSDLFVDFQKYQQNILTGDNATWKITAEVLAESDIDVNLTQVSLWVSQRNGTGTGFTNPSLVDNDTVNTSQVLEQFYYPNVLLNQSQTIWNNSGSEWLFNYTFTSSPIVWMDVENHIIDDTIQLTNREVTYGADELYIKEIYVATGYWLQINKNITRISEANYNVLVTVSNLGTSPTPASQVVIVYNFLPIEFNLTSGFVYSASPWYNTTETNETLNDPTYNGTMYQYALIPGGNVFNSSLDIWSGSQDENNTWSVEYNISGSGEFNFDDLFLTGVDPLNVEEVGGTKTLSVQNMYKVLSARGEYILSALAILIGILLFVF